MLTISFVFTNTHGFMLARDVHIHTHNPRYWTRDFKDLDKIPVSNRMPEDKTIVPVDEQRKVRQAYGTPPSL